MPFVQELQVALKAFTDAQAYVDELQKRKDLAQTKLTACKAEVDLLNAQLPAAKLAADNARTALKGIL